MKEKSMERITPADAGTRQLIYEGEKYGKDHPRGCGDKFHDSRTRNR